MQMITRTIARVLFTTVAIVVLACCEKPDAFDLASEQAKSGKVTEARAAMVKIGESGSISAMAWLMQDATNQGLDKPIARKQFVVWAERCAEKGNATCAESAGIFYWSGMDGAINFEMAEKWFVRAKANGSVSASAWLDDVRKRKPVSSSIRLMG
jgi:TPR repeat protein